LSLVVTLFAFGIAGSSACASKGFVKNSVSQVSTKVDSLSQSLEETQERTKKNEAKITEVDKKADAAQTEALNARTAATTADGKAVTADNKAAAASQSAQMAADKASQVEKASKRLTYEVVLSDSEGNFKFNAVDLPASAKAKIDELVTKLKSDPNGAYFEIEGYTDNVGPKEVNDKIALQRAEAVKRYLYEQHQIPLHRMNVIGYGPEKPAASNETKEGRAQNRRVVIKVLV
jgi:outer membrane protein OmpA-like peptidoglycan-associated protein